MTQGFLKDYEPVDERLAKFWADHPTGSVLTDMVLAEAGEFIVKSTLTDGAERIISTGYAREREGDGNVNRTSALENCETSAIGRALANGGYAAKGKRPSREEMETASHNAAATKADVDKLKARVSALDDQTRSAFAAWKDDHNFPWPWPPAAVTAMNRKLDEIAASDTDSGEQPADATATEGGPPLSPSVQPGEGGGDGLTAMASDPAPSPELPTNGDVELAGRPCSKCASRHSKRVLDGHGAVVCAKTADCAERAAQLEEPF